MSNLQQQISQLQRQIAVIQNPPQVVSFLPTPHRDLQVEDPEQIPQLEELCARLASKLHHPKTAITFRITTGASLKTVCFSQQTVTSSEGVMPLAEFEAGYQTMEKGI